MTSNSLMYPYVPAWSWVLGGSLLSLAACLLVAVFIRRAKGKLRRRLALVAILAILGLITISVAATPSIIVSSTLASSNGIGSRLKWPRDEPLVISVQRTAWAESFRWTFWATEDPSVTAVLVAESEYTGPRGWKDRGWRNYLEFGRIAEDSHEFVFTCTSPFVRGNLRIPVQLVPSINDAMSPASGPEIDAAMQAAMPIAIDMQWADSSFPPILFVGVMRSQSPKIADIAFGFVIDIIDNGEVLESIECPPPVGGDPIQGIEQIVFPECRLLRRTDHENWTLRVRGDARLALRDWSRNHYWAGEFTIPVRHAIIRPPKRD